MAGGGLGGGKSEVRIRDQCLKVVFSHFVTTALDKSCSQASENKSLGRYVGQGMTGGEDQGWARNRHRSERTVWCWKNVYPPWENRKETTLGDKVHRQTPD
ncbi:hypothetical protein PoB_002606800 [Plakobranchus ocellatus]|uniref:Uncharacterized protein n=1 Tax=Plakobranchus ocellatus TaxID=259542 RepID=A0AAV3ZYU1_9GAST|nr:hypothetical protein PoB_002606800 [Plakobranchus ocellatus]